MRSKIVLGMVLVALSVFADKAHEVFNAHRDEILSAGVTTIDGNVYLVGKSSSPRNRGDAVGWTKAEENAKWNLGNRHRATAEWLPDVTEEEKEAAWLDYRASRPNRFHVVGLQRVWSQKMPPDGYLVVLAVPSEFVSLSPPTAQELVMAVGVYVRKSGWRKRLPNGQLPRQPAKQRQRRPRVKPKQKRLNARQGREKSSTAERFVSSRLTRIWYCSGQCVVLGNC